MVMLTFYAFMLIGLAIAVLVIVLVWLTSKSDDRLTVVANWLAAGTLALAFLAGLVALQAYANASGIPDLKVRFSLPSGHPNEPRFVISEQVAYSSDIEPATQMMAAITVKNDSLYAARWPALLVSFDHMAIDRRQYSAGPGWQDTESLDEEGDAVTLQWVSAGPIHGKTYRHILLNLAGLYRVPNGGQPTINIRLIADGYRPRDVPFTVVFDTEGTPGISPGAPTKTPEWL
jgi:hypothetical protein